ncbi:hydroxylamine reductase [Sporomusaceae bacterium BoRhaA]|uniref:hydroxylamine reductase n=1 Tax=Pelorhabdus rhamnosifermentans TaxID=2772457 RepID=UPI001C05F95B|nr:hydroxylamine reductase [Pelorhabdus rhamnosifermentans]MBU2700396.1 hydroxylamine reductase [Pelorhabdus rhamnosifermentans]
MENAMFCYQCEQTAGGKGCVKMGVCGKTPEVAGLQDVLIHSLKGIGYYGWQIIQAGGKIDTLTYKFVMDTMFSTLTNVNFDPERFVSYIQESNKIKSQLKEQLGDKAKFAPAEADYVAPATKEEMLKDAQNFGIMTDQSMDMNIRSLQQTLIYGFKGMAAYAHHALVLGKKDEEVGNFFFKGLAATLDKSLGVPDWLGLCMELGKTNFKCMEMLDAANTGEYGNPEPTEILISRKAGPFIVISGHDMKDLKQLLEQTEGKGINIYTHGEMIPAHGYPELKKHKHLIGNFGTAWQNQQKEFDNLPGCVLMTTNCLMTPRDSYSDRIFATSIVGFSDMPYIEEHNGRKDFTPIINKALELRGFKEDEPERKITVGFGHHAVLSNAGKIVEAVKSGEIKHFFLIGGCDGARPGRSYYTDFADKTPHNTLMLTLACGKYRFNYKDFGTLAGFPRLLDVGQCNDSFSAIRIAVALAKAFNCGVNELPLTLVLSWYEQKAVAILLTLLSLDIHNIYIGPTLPAFFTPDVLQTLVEKFKIKLVSTAEKDIEAILGANALKA